MPIESSFTPWRSTGMIFTVLIDARLFIPGAEHKRYGRPVYVGVHETYVVAFFTECARQIHGYRALAHAPLARCHGNEIDNPLGLYAFRRSAFVHIEGNHLEIDGDIYRYLFARFLANSFAAQGSHVFCKRSRRILQQDCENYPVVLDNKALHQIQAQEVFAAVRYDDGR